MPKKRKRKRTQSILDAFAQHGVALEAKESGTQAIGDCPFCGKEDRFYVHKTEGAWDCKVCGLSGGLVGFFEQKGKANQARFRGSPALKLARDRGISAKTLREWGVGWDGRCYTIPVSGTGKVFDLRRYRLGGKIMASTGGKVSLVGKPDEMSEVVWLCEGEWDAMALWEALQAGNSPGAVYAVTGGTSFPAHVAPMFNGKDVNVAFDNDLTGQRGAVRVHNMLQGVARRLRFVHWPANLPEKYDVRDLYLKRKKAAVPTLQRLLKSAPPGVPAAEAVETEEEITGEGLTPAEVVKRYRKWMYLPLDEVLLVLFGAVLANRLDGDPVWLFLVAPPGGSKSELLMSLSGAPLIMTTTSLTPHALISGAANVGSADPSLIPKLNGKVLVVKDFTAILDLPQISRDEIFGTLRDAYDGQCEKYWGTGLHRVYHSRFGILGGVTPVVEMFGASRSMLGERFLKYRIPQSGRVKAGESIIEAALDNIGKETKMRAELQAVAHEALDLAVDPNNPPSIPGPMRKKIMQLAQWVATLRGVVRRERYTGNVEFKPTQEVGTRLAKQLARMGMGVALFCGKKELDDVAYQVVVSVARSTTPDRVEEVVKQLYLQAQEDFATVNDVAKWCRLPTGTVRNLLEDIELLKIVQRDPHATKGSRWRLSRTLMRMMHPLELYKREQAWLSDRSKAKKRRV